jgi:hypothetical protein
VKVGRPKGSTRGGRQPVDRTKGNSRVQSKHWLPVGVILELKAAAAREQTTQTAIITEALTKHLGLTRQSA